MRRRRHQGSFGGLAVLGILAAAVGAFILLGEDPPENAPGADRMIVEAEWMGVALSALAGVGFAIASAVLRLVSRHRRRSRAAALRRLLPEGALEAMRIPVDVDPLDIPGAGSRSPFLAPEPSGPPPRPRLAAGSPGRRRPGRSSRFWSRLISPPKVPGGRLGPDGAADSRWLY